MHKRFFLSFLFVLIIDQLSKYWAAQAGQTVLNTGISFGFLDGSLAIWALFVVLAVIGGVYIVKSGLYHQFPVLYGAIAGGAASNALDRVVLGGVQDWMTVPGLTLRNNIADWFIVGGLILSLVLEYSRGKKTHAA